MLQAGVQCTNPEVYGDIKRGRRLAPSKGVLCPRCQGKCCNEACLEKHKCKQRARPSNAAGAAALRVGHGRGWPLDGTAIDALTAAQLGFAADPTTLAALSQTLRQQGMLLPGVGGQYPGGIMLGAGGTDLSACCTHQRCAVLSHVTTHALHPTVPLLSSAVAESLCPPHPACPAARPASIAHHMRRSTPSISPPDSPTIFFTHTYTCAATSTHFCAGLPPLPFPLQVACP